MGADTLIDTGGILALLDRRDHWHKACVEAFQQIRLPAITSEAVLTELFHLVGESKREVQAAWKFVRSGAIAISPILDHDFDALDELMAKYHDRPMDFADATLVHIAKQQGLTQILTVDHDDFETYRIEGRRRFRIIPARHRAPRR
jgi:predicted nucleic acid-binding protein